MRNKQTLGKEIFAISPIYLWQFSSFCVNEDWIANVEFKVKLNVMLVTNVTEVTISIGLVFH